VTSRDGHFGAMHSNAAIFHVDESKGCRKTTVLRQAPFGYQNRVFTPLNNVRKTMPLWYSIRKS
jgi:hypothetical protein